MRSRPGLVVAAVGLGLALMGCGSSSTTQNAAGPSTTVPSAAQLEARLLDVSDVGAGWKVGQAINAQDLSSISQSIPCPDVTIDPAVAKRLTAVTGTQFEPTDRSTEHLIELIVTGDPTQLNDDLNTLFNVMNSCSAKTTTTAATLKLSVQTLPIPKLGDQHAAYVMTDSADSQGAFHVRNAIVRVGSVAVALGLLEGTASVQDKPQISDEAFVNLLETAVDKISG